MKPGIYKHPKYNKYYYCCPYGIISLHTGVLWEAGGECHGAKMEDFILTEIDGTTLQNVIFKYFENNKLKGE